jgi:hypothetical protein
MRFHLKVVGSFARIFLFEFLFVAVPGQYSMWHAKVGHSHMKDFVGKLDILEPLLWMLSEAEAKEGMIADHPTIPELQTFALNSDKVDLMDHAVMTFAQDIDDADRDATFISSLAVLAMCQKSIVKAAVAENHIIALGGKRLLPNDLPEYIQKVVCPDLVPFPTLSLSHPCPVPNLVVLVPFQTL